MAPGVGDRMSAQERREAILQAAMPLFAERGFDAVTTREVAEAAGVSEALLYRHFEGKAGLYEAIQHTCIAEATTDVRKLQALPDGTATLVLAAYMVMTRIQLNGQSAQPSQASIPRLILRSLLTDGAFARGFVKSSAAQWIDKIKRCIDAGIAAGEIEESAEHALDAVWLAHHVACAVVFYRLPQEPVIDYPTANDTEKMIERTVRFALRGIGIKTEAITKHYRPEAFALLRSDALAS